MLFIIYSLGCHGVILTWLNCLYTLKYTFKFLSNYEDVIHSNILFLIFNSLFNLGGQRLFWFFFFFLKGCLHKLDLQFSISNNTVQLPIMAYVQYCTAALLHLSCQLTVTFGHLKWDCKENEWQERAKEAGERDPRRLGLYNYTLKMAYLPSLPARSCLLS